MTKPGGSNDRVDAKFISSDLREFFHVTPLSSGKQSIYRLLNRSNLELFVQYITKYKPVVLSEKIQSLKVAIRYIMSLRSEDYNCANGWSLLRLLTDLQQSPVEKSVDNEMVGLATYKMH